MILACPSCATRYLISAHLFTAGPRQVRCARCLHGWQVELPKEIDAVGPPPDADLTPVPDAVTPIPPGSNLPVVRRNSIPRALFRSLVIGVPVTILVLLLSWLYFDRYWIVETWPALDKVYEKIGIHVYFYGEGLKFEDVRSELRYDGGRMLLAVEGKVHNGADAVLRIPDITATAIGVDGKVVQSWQIDSPAVIVFPGEADRFDSSIDAPKEAVTEVTLSFVDKKSIYDK